jgi:hypothetical protein
VRQVLPEAIIEKDFWVCWMLKQLFSIDTLTGRLLFKGGTSLSKIFHAINRFSEDIDLAVDYEALGFKGERDPRRQDISKTKRAGILDEMMAECRQYIVSEFLDVLQARCGEILGATDAWSLESEAKPKLIAKHSDGVPGMAIMTSVGARHFHAGTSQFGSACAVHSLYPNADHREHSLRAHCQHHRQQTMAKPVLLTVDDDADVVQAIKRAPRCLIQRITRITGWRLHYCVSRVMGGSAGANEARSTSCRVPWDRVHRQRLSVSKPRFR